MFVRKKLADAGLPCGRACGLASNDVAVLCMTYRPLQSPFGTGITMYSRSVLTVWIKSGSSATTANPPSSVATLENGINGGTCDAAALLLAVGAAAV